MREWPRESTCAHGMKCVVFGSDGTECSSDCATSSELRCGGKTAQKHGRRGHTTKDRHVETVGVAVGSFGGVCHKAKSRRFRRHTLHQALRRRRTRLQHIVFFPNHPKNRTKASGKGSETGAEGREGDTCCQGEAKTPAQCASFRRRGAVRLTVKVFRQVRLCGHRHGAQCDDSDSG